MVQVIGLGEYAVCTGEEDCIKTYALASCIGLVVYDPLHKKLGMAHIVYPTKRTDDSSKDICFFADNAVPFLFEKVFGRFPDKKTSYQVSLYGGVSTSSSLDVFKIGEKNIQCVEDILIANHIWYDKTHTSGTVSRTITAFSKDGHVSIKKQTFPFFFTK